MKTLLTAGIATLALLAAPVAQADPAPWCEWTPGMDMTSCGLIVDVPPTGQLVSEPGDWTAPETRTK